MPATYLFSHYKKEEISMKYCKKPVVIDAIQLEDSVECMEALSSLGLDPIVFSYADEDPVLKIETLEGTMIANIGDYIIKGVNGEFYPCKPDIFGKSYEEFYPLSRVDLPLIQNPENTFFK